VIFHFSAKISFTVYVHVLHVAALYVGDGGRTKLGREPTGQLFLALAWEKAEKSTISPY
jgi:hypothetical protein